MKKEKTAKTEKNEKHWERVTQEFAPVCDADCRVLILGTAPSKKSREVGFYYGHPQNRFWKMACSSDGREGSPKHRGKEGTAAAQPYCSA